MSAYFSRSPPPCLSRSFAIYCSLLYQYLTSFELYSFSHLAQTRAPLCPLLREDAADSTAVHYRTTKPQMSKTKQNKMCGTYTVLEFSIHAKQLFQFDCFHFTIRTTKCQYLS